MKQRKKPQPSAALNFVAKQAYHFNKTIIFSDKTKFNRKVKHKNMESFPVASYS